MTIEVQVTGPHAGNQEPFIIGQTTVHSSVHWAQLDRTVTRYVVIIRVTVILTSSVETLGLVGQTSLNLRFSQDGICFGLI